MCIRQLFCLATTHALAANRPGEHSSHQARWRLPLGWVLLLTVSALLLAPGAFAQNLNPLLAIIAPMPEGTWAQVNQNAFSDVWTPPNLRLHPLWGRACQLWRQ